MQRKKGLTLVELIVTILIVALALPILFSAARYAGQERVSCFQVHNGLRGVHSGLVLYSQGNNGYYPGIMADGTTIDPATGLTPQGRISRLIEENYFSLEYARSPSEAQTNTTSYALLQVNVSADGQTVDQSGRNVEWRNTNNNQSVVLSDRALPYQGSWANIQSIHTTGMTGPNKWNGQVAWNDNHVTFETTSIISTVYGKKAHALDNLFSTPGDAHTGDDAFMVWSGTSDL